MLGGIARKRRQPSRPIQSRPRLSAPGPAPPAKLRKLAEVCDPSTSVLVVGERNDVVLYRALRDLGVVEYFFKPVVPELLERTCQAAIGGQGEGRVS